MNKKLTYVAILVFGWMQLVAQNPTDPEIYKLSVAYHLISNLYVDSVDNHKLVEDGIRGMLEKLDPHSDYLDPQETKELTEPLQGNFDGIGIQFNMLTDTLYVIQVIPGGPSEKVGLMPGDRIIQVNDTVIAGVNMKNSDIMSRLRGKKGTEVRVKVKRGNNPELIEFRIIRDKIPVYSLDAAYMADSKTGYIRLNRFAATSAQEFRDALKKLKKEGMEQLILDLQGNGGGYLHTAIQIADEFLSNGKLVVYTEGNKQPREDADATGRGDFENGRLVILVDEGSASASEILAGAIQDWDRGLIIGRRTFGKGLVQKPIDLPDGSMIRLTIARYYTPTGRSIQRPFETGKTQEYRNDVYERYGRGELTNADSIHFSDSLKYKTLINERTVYGGGGIMPDVFIPLDTTRSTAYHAKLVASGLIYRSAMNYVDRSRSDISSTYADFDQFNRNFRVTDTMLQDLVDLATAEKIEYNAEQFNQAKELIQHQLKALIARDVYDMGEYIQILNQENEIYKRALQIINDEGLYREYLGY